MGHYWKQLSQFRRLNSQFTKTVLQIVSVCDNTRNAGKLLIERMFLNGLHKAFIVSIVTIILKLLENRYFLELALLLISTIVLLN